MKVERRKMIITKEMILLFLQTVDNDFPIPLSSKTDLQKLATKIYEHASVYAEIENDRIIAMVAGYMNDFNERKAYISIVGTLPEARRRGLASQLIKNFIIDARLKGMIIVHLYTDSSNRSAINLYMQTGFEEYIVENEPRPSDKHLIYYLGGRYT